MSDRIFELLKESGKTQAELAVALGITEDKISKWKHGISKSYNKYTTSLADFFGVSPDYILCKTDERKKPTAFSDDELAEINRIFSDLSTENRAKLTELATLYLNEQKKKKENQ